MRTVNKGTRITLTYKNMQLQFNISAKSERRPSLDTFQFSTDTLQTNRGISINDSKQKVLNTYGSPEVEEAWFPFIKACEETVSYYEPSNIGGYTTTGISFCIKEEKVVEIILGEGST